MNENRLKKQIFNTVMVLRNILRIHQLDEKKKNTRYYRKRRGEKGENGWKSKRERWREYGLMRDPRNDMGYFDDNYRERKKC